MKRADLTDLTDALAEFAKERGWSTFHSPKNLLLALVGEVGELASEFQWLTEDMAGNLGSEDRGRVADELADVLLYLVRLADVLEIDLGEAAFRKMEANAQRYPADEVFGSARKMPH